MVPSASVSGVTAKSMRALARITEASRSCTLPGWVTATRADEYETFPAKPTRPVTHDEGVQADTERGQEPLLNRRALHQRPDWEMEAGVAPEIHRLCEARTRGQEGGGYCKNTRRYAV